MDEELYEDLPGGVGDEVIEEELYDSIEAFQGGSLPPPVQRAPPAPTTATMPQNGPPLPNRNEPPIGGPAPSLPPRNQTGSQAKVANLSPQPPANAPQLPARSPTTTMAPQQAALAKKPPKMKKEVASKKDPPSNGLDINTIQAAAMKRRVIDLDALEKKSTGTKEDTASSSQPPPWANQLRKRQPSDSVSNHSNEEEDVPSWVQRRRSMSANASDEDSLSKTPNVVPPPVAKKPSGNTLPRKPVLSTTPEQPPKPLTPKPSVPVPAPKPKPTVLPKATPSPKPNHVPIPTGTGSIPSPDAPRTASNIRTLFESAHKDKASPVSTSAPVLAPVLASVSGQSPTLAPKPQTGMKVPPPKPVRHDSISTPKSVERPTLDGPPDFTPPVPTVPPHVPVVTPQLPNRTIEPLQDTPINPSPPVPTKSIPQRRYSPPKLPAPPPPSSDIPAAPQKAPMPPPVETLPVFTAPVPQRAVKRFRRLPIPSHDPLNPPTLPTRFTKPGRSVGTVSKEPSWSKPPQMKAPIGGHLPASQLIKPPPPPPEDEGEMDELYDDVTPSATVAKKPAPLPIQRPAVQPTTVHIAGVTTTESTIDDDGELYDDVDTVTSQMMSQKPQTKMMPPPPPPEEEEEEYEVPPTEGLASRGVAEEQEENYDLHPEGVAEVEEENYDLHPSEDIGDEMYTEPPAHEMDQFAGKRVPPPPISAPPPPPPTIEGNDDVPIEESFYEMVGGNSPATLAAPVSNGVPSSPNMTKKMSKSEVKEQKKKEKELEREKERLERERERLDKERKKKEELRQKNRRKYFVKNFKQYGFNPDAVPIIYATQAAKASTKGKDHLILQPGENVMVLLTSHEKLPEGKYMCEKEDGTVGLVDYQVLRDNVENDFSSQEVYDDVQGSFPPPSIPAPPPPT